MLINRNVLISLMLLAFTTAFSTTSIADGHFTNESPKKFEGTYVYSSEDSDNFVASTTLHRGGTASTLSGAMFNDDQGRRLTPRHGIWRRVGIRKIRVTQLSFWTGVDTHDYITDDGNTGLMVVISYLMKFDEPVNDVLTSYKIKDLSIEIFLPNQNPAIDEGVLVETPSTGKGYRLFVE